ncbi:hypothetical protein FRC00_002871 [Tulasnella sp. 408]|nr:hypothetical protein FRC00_002871 [Tulasnella sp. 408]
MTESTSLEEGASDDYQSLLLWAKRIRERIIDIENAKQPIFRLPLKLLQKVLLYEVDNYFESWDFMPKRRDDLRRVARCWRDAIDSSQEWWRWMFATATRNDVHRCLRHNVSNPIYVFIRHSFMTGDSKSAIKALTGAVNRIQFLCVDADFNHGEAGGSELRSLLSLPMPSLSHLTVFAKAKQPISINLGEGAPLKVLDLTGRVSVPWNASRLASLRDLSIANTEGPAPDSNGILQMTYSRVLESISLTNITLEGSNTTFPSRATAPVFPRPDQTRPVLKPINTRAHPTPDIRADTPIYYNVSLDNVRVPLRQPESDGSLIWRLLKLASANQGSYITIQIENTATEDDEDLATVTRHVVDAFRRLHVCFEVKECSALVQFFSIGSTECLSLPIIGIWCTSHLLDFSPILLWLTAPHALGGGRLCPLLGNLEFYRCDNPSEGLFDRLEQRILDFDEEEKSHHPLAQNLFKLWVHPDDLSTNPIFRWSVLRDHCQDKT